VKASLTLAIGLGLAAAACGGAPSSSTASSTPAPAGGGYFVVPASQLSHLQIVPAVKATWTTTLQTTATVDWDNDHTTQVISQVSGPVTRLAVDVGARVKAGDPLLYVSSPDITSAIAAYRKSKNRLGLAQRTLDRSRDLLAHKAISQADFDSTEADFNDASTDAQNAIEPLKVLGVSQADLDAAEHQDQPIRPELPMRSPISGTVVQRLVLPGQIVQAGATQAFLISDVSTVWVQGHIYEQDLQRVRVGDEVDERTAAFPDVFHGTVAYIDHMVDPATRTTLVRIVTRNPGGLLKKDMFVDVTLHDRASRDVVAVPKAAVLYDDQNMPFVYVQLEPGKFAQRLVTIGGQQDDQIEIRDGVKAGDPVVSQGSVFLQFANSFGS
jgi:cobalt-zinc-cadmium efflux system membrane fusion protein